MSRLDLDAVGEDDYKQLWGWQIFLNVWNDPNVSLG